MVDEEACKHVQETVEELGEREGQREERERRQVEWWKVYNSK